MAIVSCPQCNKQISDKAATCSHCDVELNKQTAESIASAGRVKRIEQAQSIQTQTFIALILFVGGFSLWYWQDTLDDQWYNTLGQGMIAVGFIWYLVNRIRLMVLKRQK